MVVSFLGLMAAASLAKGQSSQASFQLRLERTNQVLELVVSSISETGAVFIYRGAELRTLAEQPVVFVETNTPAPGGLRWPLDSGGEYSNQAFFAAALFTGHSVEEFGDPEYGPREPEPTMILLAAGMPPALISDESFTVDFFVTDPAGWVVDVSGPVEIRVLRSSDGALHPDAVVVPPTGELLGGHMRVEVTVRAATSLEGYTLGLGPSAGAGGGVGSAGGAFVNWSSLAQPGGPPLQLDRILKLCFNLGPEPLSSPTAENLFQRLEEIRQDAADSDPSWSDPLEEGALHGVSGTFGEWRGQGNANVHRGLDLTAPAGSEIHASRGGVVSHRGVSRGGYIVIDHGDGWFSRYLGLADGGVEVCAGQLVARGERLASGLGLQGDHLHFEIQQGHGQAQWGVADPGNAQDPLQTPGVFAVRPGDGPPELAGIGWTRRHPGQNAFVKRAPGQAGAGPVYLFARWADKEATEGGWERRLGLRSMSFRAEGMAEPDVIHPSNDTAVAQLLPPGADQRQGFARYGASHIAKEDPENHFQYWWEWDTDVYTNDWRGPRAVFLRGVDGDGNAADHDLMFGPQIKGGLLTPLGGQQFQFTVVAHLGTNLAPWFVQPDQYELEILQFNRQPLTGVLWAGPVSGNLTKVFVSHLEEGVYTLTLPQGTGPEWLTLRVSSLLAPNLAREVCFCEGPNMVWVPPGTFIMGSPLSEVGRYPEETQHEVTISRGFCLGRYEVTQAEYWEVLGMNPSYFQGANRPVEMVGWFEAVAYCEELTRREKAAGRLPEGHVYRLPTEAEWEYACRAGTTTAFHYGTALRSGMANFYGPEEYDSFLGTIDNPSGIYLGQTTTVGSYVPSEWGLHEMHGNVWEWCQDWYGVYAAGSVTDPTGPTTGLSRVCRGGSWSHGGRLCRAACRYGNSPDDPRIILGFRVVIASDQP